MFLFYGVKLWGKREEYMMTVEEYKARVASAKRIVFFGGAGVSTESGIPDFRSVDGL